LLSESPRLVVGELYIYLLPLKQVTFTSLKPESYISAGVITTVRITIITVVVVVVVVV
jgi:hypothetical protein